MFDDDDPLLERIRKLCAELPGTHEKVSHGRPAFFTKKVFAYYGGSFKLDGEWVQHPRSVMVQLDAGDRQALSGRRPNVRACLPRSLRVDRR